MTPFFVFETVVITAIVGWSLHRVVRQYAPKPYRIIRAWLAARLGLAPLQEASGSAGCDSGCGTCSTGCGNETPAAQQPSGKAEHVVHFHPKRT